MLFALAALSTGAASSWMVPTRTKGVAEATTDSRDKAAIFMIRGMGGNRMHNDKVKEEMELRE